MPSLVLYFYFHFFHFLLVSSSIDTSYWKSELSRLPFPSYFGKIVQPGNIRFIDFLQTSANSTSFKRVLHHSWITVILPELTKSACQALRETGTKLTQSWPIDKQVGEVTRFWQNMEEKEAKDQHLHALHVAVYEREMVVTKSHMRDILLDIGTGESCNDF